MANQALGKKIALYDTGCYGPPYGSISLSKSDVYPEETLSLSKKVVEINNLCIIGSRRMTRIRGSNFPAPIIQQ